MMESVELITDGHAHIVVIDGEVKLRRNADGTWNSSEAGWSVNHPRYFSGLMPIARNHGRLGRSSDQTELLSIMCLV